MGLRVWGFRGLRRGFGLGLGVGFRVWDLGFRVFDIGLRV